MSLLANIQILDSVDSTNSYALRNFDSLPDGSLTIARSQSAGRGRKDRNWASPPDVNAYVSLTLKGFSFLASQASWVGSLAALDALRAEAPNLDFKVKWPNDILCGGAKIAGILCEAKSGGIVIGIGVNLNMTRAELDKLGRPATSLLAETGKHVEDAVSFAIEMGEKAMIVYENAKKDGIETLYSRWSRETGLAGARVKALMDDGRSFSGTVQALLADGSLAIRRDDGQLLHFASGEISLRSL